ncbi:hypothetical protein FKM82_022645 [Ascaphus truei]
MKNQHLHPKVSLCLLKICRLREGDQKQTNFFLACYTAISCRGQGRFCWPCINCGSPRVFYNNRIGTDCAQRTDHKKY